MRSLFFQCLLCGFLATAVTAQDTALQWTYVEDAPTSRGRHDDVKFATPDWGWVVNTAGEIWHTSSAGATWNQQMTSEQSGVAFRSLGVRDQAVAWAGSLTPGSTLWETRDGGEHWTDISDRMNGTLPQGICGMFVASADVAYGVGAFFGSPILVKTSNGGINWTAKTLHDRIATMIDVYFWDEMTGIAIGGTGGNLDGNAAIIRTEDGGETWTEVFQSTRKSGIQGEWGWKISFPSPDVGYVSVETISNPENHPAKILKTEDGGLTWREIEVDGSASRAGLQGVGFISKNIGWASGRGVTSLTTDGGDTWTQLSHYDPDTGEGQLDGNINRFYSVNDTLSYAVGSRVYQLSGYGSVTTSVQEAAPIPRVFDLYAAYPNPFTESTTLEYTLHKPGPVRLAIIDQLGRTIRSFPDRTLSAGTYSERWDGRDNNGNRVSAGSYIMLIDIGDSMETKHVVFLK